MIEAIAKLVRCESLTEAEAASAFETIMRGDATPTQIAGFVVALRMKGETVDELTGFARTARQLSTPIDVALEATGSPPSTSRPFRRSSPPLAAPGLPSTATAPPPRCADRQTCWSGWA